MAEKQRKLAGAVFAGGRWYRPGDDVPDDVAKTITNPGAWTEGDAPGTDEAATSAKPDAVTGVRLAGRVNVGGTWYGPDDELPRDVVARITNPAAWEGGKVPDLDTGPAPRTAGEGDDTPPADDDPDEQGDDQTGEAATTRPRKATPAKRTPAN